METKKLIMSITIVFSIIFVGAMQPTLAEVLDYDTILGRTWDTDSVQIIEDYTGNYMDGDYSVFSFTYDVTYKNGKVVTILINWDEEYPGQIAFYNLDTGNNCYLDTDVDGSVTRVFKQVWYDTKGYSFD